MFGIFQIIVLLLIAAQSYASNENCTLESACTCNLKSAGLLNLAGSGGGLDYIEITSGVYTYRYYPCGVKADWGGVCTIENHPAVCQQTRDGEYYVLGKSNSYEITRAVAKGDNTYFDFLFQDGTSDFINGRRNATVRVMCDIRGSHELKFISESPIINYNFVFMTPKACLYKQPDAPIGNILFIVLMVTLPVGLILYLGIGVGIMACKGERRLGLIPNIGFWIIAPFLFFDGFLFVFSCIPFVRKYLKKTIEEDYEKMPS
ncbi:hypothetical protein LOD99_5957 [Oopsacas minuta]|uniref:Uncharacterized protein n=1 Tax=Oopsacas minuta TaxID=111878 RepID=A0AAV7JMX4_9METZ|nr:hypothetical protein LOD99_5957 [Oopsacas minuta]